MLYSTEDQLGWDTTMQHRGGGQYDILVRTKSSETLTFRTLEILSNVGAESPLSRGTRVWKCKQVVKNRTKGPPVVLKDVWIDDDRRREGDIMSLIRSDYVRLQGPRSEAPIDKFFLPVVCHGDVFINTSTNGLQLDNTCSLMMQGRLVQDSPVYDLLPYEGAEDASTQTLTVIGTYHPRVSKKEEPQRVILHPKTHYRLVTASVCSALHEEISLGKFVISLAHAICGECL